jgi:hypothetical protein
LREILSRGMAGASAIGGVDFDRLVSHVTIPPVLRSAYVGTLSVWRRDSTARGQLQKPHVGPAPHCLMLLTKQRFHGINSSGIRAYFRRPNG